MFRFSIRSMGPLILFVTFWLLLGANVVSSVGNAEKLGDKVEIVKVDYEIKDKSEDSVSLVVIAIVENGNDKDISASVRIDVLSSNKAIKRVDLKNKFVAKSSQAKLTENVTINIGVGEITELLKVRGKILEVKEAT